MVKQIVTLTLLLSTSAFAMQRGAVIARAALRGTIQAARPQVQQAAISQAMMRTRGFATEKENDAQQDHLHQQKDLLRQKKSIQQLAASARTGWRVALPLSSVTLCSILPHALDSDASIAAGFGFTVATYIAGMWKAESVINREEKKAITALQSKLDELD